MKLLLIGISEEKISKLQDALSTAGLDLVSFNGQQDSLYPLIEQQRPEIILIDTSSTARDTLEHLAQLDRNHARTVISLGRNSESINRLAAETGLSLYAVDSVAVSLLQALTDVVISQLISRDKLAREVASMRPVLAQQRDLHSAIKFIMEKYGLADTQARDLLAKNAKHQKRGIADVARHLMETGSLP
ncbi:hypothetical protein IB286_08820 [Spongiibacter sp. KMU-158]|uniref:ANTAR domain-containing protein n=1 Tax=Spongiibacter pelagi TaxID=2760804 RepID=A0A927GVX0_9GAMM|nr:hypothetical protein [Spongiibacter pelagi]MBD2859111.1 hypothetical protein [Spongiibacter pelagi]